MAFKPPFSTRCFCGGIVLGLDATALPDGIFCRNGHTAAGELAVVGSTSVDFKPFNYARYVDSRIDFGRANPKRFLTLTNPTACAADAACPGLWNPFKAGTLTDAMMDYAFLPNSPVVRGVTKQFQANLSGDFGDFELPAVPAARARRPRSSRAGRASTGRRWRCSPAPHR